jgi:hypothetical protein
MGETDIRVAAETVPTVTMPTMDQPGLLAAKLPVNDFPGIVITLQTCSFRC